MLLISHRGNIDGINKSEENKIDYINNAINQGFEVEVDVRAFNNKLYLGHDKPDTSIDNNFLLNKKIWCHAKDFEALIILQKLNCIYFWHEDDDYTLTSNGYIWTYPGKKLNHKSICVLPELFTLKDIKCAGICSDYIKRFKCS